MSKETVKDRTIKDTIQNLDVPKRNEDVDPEEYNMESVFVSLYMEEPFLGTISSNIVRKEDWTVPTAYMAFDRKNYCFYLGYNPEFMRNLSKETKHWVIKHEIYHLIFRHMIERFNTDRKTKKLSNVAADLAVNSLLEEKSAWEHALLPGKKPIVKEGEEDIAEMFLRLEKQKTLEFYYETLLAFFKKRQKDKCPVCAQNKQNKQNKKKNQQNKQSQQGQGQQSPSNQPGGQDQQQGEGSDGQGNQGQQQGQRTSQTGEGSDCSHGDGHGHEHNDNQNNGNNGNGSGQGQDGQESENNQQGSGNGELCEEHSPDGTDYEFSFTDGEGQTVDSHEHWDEIDEDVKDFINDKVKEMIGKGIQRVQQNGSWGSVPASIQEEIAKLLTNEIDWKTMLRWFLGKARSEERDSTIKRINKKAPYVFPGIRRKTNAKLVFFIDQSGSMGNDDVQLAMSAAFECSKETEIDVFNFDTSVDEKSHQVWSRTKQTSWRRTRSGGTDFNCIPDFVSRPEFKNKWSGVVILTDGYADTLRATPGLKIMWLLTPHSTTACARPGDFLLKMKEEKVAKKI